MNSSLTIKFHQITFDDSSFLFHLYIDVQNLFIICNSQRFNIKAKYITHHVYKIEFEYYYNQIIYYDQLLLKFL